MALTRKFLTAMGIDAEKVDEIINAHAETVDALKEDRDKFKATAEKLPGVQKELDDLKAAQGEDKSGEWKTKYETEHQAFEKFKTDTAAEKALNAKKTAYRDILKDAGITAEKSVEKVLKYTSFDSLELDENGKFQNAADLLKAAKEEWPELITTQGQQGAQTGNPPANNGTSAFAAMNLAEKMAYANDHPGDAEVAAWLKNPFPAKTKDKE